MTAAPHARLIHHTRGRARLRVPSERGNVDFFAELGDKLARVGAVSAVEVAPLTGSVVLRFDGELDDVVRSAERERLFVMETLSSRGPGSSLESIRASIHQLDARLLERTQGRWGLRAIAFYGLVGGAAFQIRRGNVLPAATALVFQALSMLNGPTQDDAAASADDG